METQSQNTIKVKQNATKGELTPRNTRGFFASASNCNYNIWSNQTKVKIDMSHEISSKIYYVIHLLRCLLWKIQEVRDLALHKINQPQKLCQNF